MTRSNRQQNWITLSILFLVLAAFVLRVYRLDYFSLRGDESFTVIFIQRTWEGMWRGIRFIEPNPPLLYLALRGWVALAGAGEFATRFFSVWFGVLCVPLAYRLGREIFSSGAFLPRAPWIGLFTATLLAINPYQIWHSQDVRNYTMWPALSLAALIFFWRWWNDEQTGRSRAKPSLALYFVFTLTSLYTHYYDTFILVAQNILVFTFALAARRWLALARWLGVQVALVLAYSPWVLFGTDRIRAYGEASAEQGVTLLQMFSRTLTAFALSETVSEELRANTWVPLGLALFVVLARLAWQDRLRAAFLLLYIAIPTLALYVISIGRPLFLERYLNGIAPASYITFAVGLSMLWPPRARWHIPIFYAAISFFALTPALALSNYWFNPAFAKAPDWRGLAQFINSRWREGDIIVQNFNEMSAQYYRRGNATIITVPRDYWWRVEDAKTLRQVNQDYLRIWFIPAQPDWWDPEQDVEKFLARTADRELETHISVFRLQLYSTPRTFEPRMTPVNAQIGEGTLIGYRVQNEGSVLRVVLYWRAKRDFEQSLNVFAQLADANERTVAQSEGMPVDGTYPTTSWLPDELIVDAHALTIPSAGTFSLAIGMHDPKTKTRVPAFNSQGVRLAGDRLILTQIVLP